MNNRIKTIRQAAGLTQMQFAERIGLSRNYIALLEVGQRAPADRTIADICREFHVNEDWLRTGEGEPFAQLSREDTIAAYVGRINGGKITDIEESIIKFMAETPVEEWESLAKALRRFAETMKEHGAE